MRSYLVFFAVTRLASADESCAEADETTLLQGRLMAREADTEMQTQPPSLRNHNQQCWHRNQCAAQGGYCASFCGSGRCCRRGFSARNEKERNECGASGTVGLSHMHTCQPAAYHRGSPDGSCPAGTLRVTAEDCPSLNGQSLSDGTALSNSHHRTDCAGHFTPGAGCFVNIHGNVYSTAWECPAAQTQSAYWDRSHMAVCAPITELVRGGADGSCPAGTTRVTSEDCPNLNGLSLSDGTALSNQRHRTDCAGHFTRGEGCFVNSDNNVYSTAPGCAEAEQLTPFWAARHFAVCVRNGAGASLLQEEQAVVQETVEEDEDLQEVEASTGLPGAPQYIGCFTDNRRRDMGRWLGNRDNAATNTFASCASACDKTYMSLQSGGECFCSDSYGGDGYNQVDDSQCGPVAHINANCASNSHSCGGHWRNAVYRNPGQGAAHYIGCFTDNRRRDMGRWLGNRDNAATNTFAGCAGACDKAFMSLQSGGECFCSDSYGGDGYNQVDDSQCGPVAHINANCASNSHSCGGHWRNAVYRTPRHASLLQAEYDVVQGDFEEQEEEEEMDFEANAEDSVTDWSTDSAGLPGAAQYIGCFTDNRGRDMGSWLGNRDNAATNTFEGCRAACNRRYLALQSGGECFCSDTYATSSSYRQVADSQCNRNNEPCSSNSHNCGGHWRQAIYHNRASFNFGAIGANSCPGGGNVGQAECLAAAQGLLARGQRQGRGHLVAGSWGWVPPGCSIQTHRTHGQAGDFAAHFNRGGGRNDGGYTPVCNSECRVLRNQDVVAGTFEHYGRDHGGAATDAACSAACTADPECTAWVRQPSSGRCWISRQSVVTFEADRDRNTGLRCN